MRFIVQDYLAHIKERDELDAILPDLLRSMGFQIVKLAFRGEVEHGVDIAALRKEKDDDWILYLIQVKPGDIDQKNWDAGPNSIRATLNNLLDVPFEDLTKAQLQKAKKQVILAHNGTLRQNVRDRFNGYIKNEFLPRMPFDRWDLDHLAEMFHTHLLNERILPNKEHQRLLKRTLIFLDVPDYDLADFKQLIREFLPDVRQLKKQQRNRIFGFLRLTLAMIAQQCQQPDFNNLTPAVTAHEYALLVVWGWMQRNDLFQKKVLEEFSETFFRFLQISSLWAGKIASSANIPAGLSLNASFERVEYPLRTFEVIGNLGILTTIWFYMGNNTVATQNQQIFAQLLMNVIRNNASRHRPLLDNHSIDIFLGMWALLLTGHADFVKWWLSDILEHLAIRKNMFGRLPELYNKIDLVIEYEATGERPIGYIDSSSTLLYMLFELCLLLSAEDLYSNYTQHFDEVDFQVWYPPENVEDILYYSEVHGGDTETIQRLPESFEEFRLDVQSRHQEFDHSKYSPIEQGFPILLLLACKHFRTPVFPFWWRELMVAWQIIEGSDGKRRSEES